MEHTLSIVKPDAVAANHIGDIIQRLERGGLAVVACKMLRLTRAKAESFYAVHQERPFFPDLVEFMCSGPVLVQVLQGENAVQKNRNIMGATNPSDAAPGTIRADFASDVQRNAVHGSDSLENAAVEIAHFFTSEDLCPRS